LDIQDSAIVLDEYVAESQELMKECGYWNIDSGLVTGSITLPIEESPVKPKGTANTIFYNMGAVNHYYEDSVPEGSVKIRNRIHYIAGQKPG
jgi:hypothetical protein